MSFIEKLSKYISKKVADVDGCLCNIEHYEYSISAILHAIFYFIVSTLIAIPWGYWPFIIPIMILTVNLRSLCGGAHAYENPYICMSSTILSHILIGLSIVYLHSFYIIFFISSLLIFTGLSEIPKYTRKALEEELIHTEERQKEMRISYIKCISGITIANFIMVALSVFEIYDFSDIIVMMCSCLLFVRFMLTKFAFRIYE